MKAQTLGRFAMLSAVPFIMVLGNSMLIPVLPEIESVLGRSKFEVGLMITMFSIPAGIVIPFAGALSDRVGRKTVMVPALFLYGIGGLIAGLGAVWLAENSYWVVMGGRFLQGVGAGGTYQLAMALTGDIFQSSERTKALGLLEASNGLGKVISPIAGAAAALITWYTPFFIYGVLAIPIALGVWFIVKEPRRDQKASLKQYFSRVADVFKAKGVSLAASFLAGALVLFVLFGMLSYYSDILEDEYGIAGFTKGFVIAGPVLAMAITSYVTGTVLQKQIAKLLKLLCCVGLGLVAGGLALAAFTRGAVLLFVAMTVIGIGNGLVLPSLNMLITSAAKREARGAVTALYGTVRFFGVAIGPPAFGLTDTLGHAVVIGAAAALAAGVGLVGAWLIKQEQMLPEDMQQGQGQQRQGQGEQGAGQPPAGQPAVARFEPKPSPEAGGDRVKSPR